MLRTCFGSEALQHILQLKYDWFQIYIKYVSEHKMEISYTWYLRPSGGSQSMSKNMKQSSEYNQYRDTKFRLYRTAIIIKAHAKQKSNESIKDILNKIRFLIFKMLYERCSSLVKRWHFAEIIFFHFLSESTDQLDNLQPKAVLCDSLAHMGICLLEINCKKISNYGRRQDATQNFAENIPAPTVKMEQAS